jgi:hypothetical protein
MMLPSKTAIRRGSGFANVVAVLALLIAVAALAYAVCHDPNGPITKMRNPLDPPLVGYDFSSPAAALKADMQMQSKGDLRAHAELTKQIRGPELKEQLDSLEVKKEADFKQPDPLAGPGQAGKFRDLKLLFVTFKKNGESQYTVEALVKHPDSGLWQRTVFNYAYAEATDKALAKEVRDWDSQNVKK